MTAPALLHNGTNPTAVFDDRTRAETSRPWLAETQGQRISATELGKGLEPFAKIRDAVGNRIDEFVAFQQREYDRWGEVIRARKITAD